MPDTMDYPVTRQGVRDLNYIPSNVTKLRHPNARQQEGACCSANVGDTERLISLVAGTAMIGAGMYERGLTGAILGLAGIALGVRGATGYCAGYAAAGISTR